MDQDGLLPFKKMFANAGEKDKKGENHLKKWNNLIVLLTDLQEEENKH